MPAVFFLQGEEQNFVERKKRNGYNYLKRESVLKRQDRKKQAGEEECFYTDGRN